MKQTIKIGITACAFAAVASAFAQEPEAPAETPEVVETEGAVGWTPLAIGIATPVQLPWGFNRWDVFGLDFNLLYSDAPTAHGLDIGLVALQTRQVSKGVYLSAFFNGAHADVYGVRATLGLNLTRGKSRGVELGSLAFRDAITGVDLNFLGAAQKNVTGVQVSGLANVTSVESYGVTLAGGCNLARTAYGVQFAIFYNQTDELNGCQIGLVNFADECVSGFQIGLINIILSNRLKFLPFVNGYF